MSFSRDHTHVLRYMVRDPAPLRDPFTDSQVLQQMLGYASAPPSQQSAALHVGIGDVEIRKMQVLQGLIAHSHLQEFPPRAKQLLQLLAANLTVSGMGQMAAMGPPQSPRPRSLPGSRPGTSPGASRRPLNLPPARPVGPMQGGRRHSTGNAYSHLGAQLPTSPQCDAASVQGPVDWHAAMARASPPGGAPASVADMRQLLMKLQDAVKTANCMPQGFVDLVMGSQGVSRPHSPGSAPVKAVPAQLAHMLGAHHRQLQAQYPPGILSAALASLGMQSGIQEVGYTRSWPVDSHVGAGLPESRFMPAHPSQPRTTGATHTRCAAPKPQAATVVRAKNPDEQTDIAVSHRQTDVATSQSSGEATDVDGTAQAAPRPATNDIPRGFRTPRGSAAVSHVSPEVSHADSPAEDPATSQAANLLLDLRAAPPRPQEGLLRGLLRAKRWRGCAGVKGMGSRMLEEGMLSAWASPSTADARAPALHRARAGRDDSHSADSPSYQRRILQRPRRSSQVEVGQPSARVSGAWVSPSARKRKLDSIAAEVQWEATPLADPETSPASSAGGLPRGALAARRCRSLQSSPAQKKRTWSLR